MIQEIVRAAIAHKRSAGRPKRRISDVAQRGEKRGRRGYVGPGNGAVYFINKPSFIMNYNTDIIRP